MFEEMENAPFEQVFRWFETHQAPGQLIQQQRRSCQAWELSIKTKKSLWISCQVVCITALIAPVFQEGLLQPICYIWQSFCLMMSAFLDRICHSSKINE